MNSQTSFPLSWPAGWPRENCARSAAFGSDSVDQCTREILAQLKLAGVGNWAVVISSNVPLRRDGLPFSTYAKVRDAGAAVYFKINDKPAVLACDRWRTVEENLWSIAKHLEAMRGQNRWGVGSIERAFAGYTALPPAGSKPARSWREVLSVEPGDTLPTIKEQFYAAVRRWHPDAAGGSHDSMSEINGAWTEAKKEFPTLATI